jgi:hypothetical protein
VNGGAIAIVFGKAAHFDHGSSELTKILKRPDWESS